MTHRMTYIALFALAMCLTSLGDPGSENRYGFLDRFEGSPGTWIPETERQGDEDISPTRVDLLPFYNEFASDKTVTFYIGFGIDAYTLYRMEELFEMLQELGKSFDLNLGDWQLDTAKSMIVFTDLDTSIRYEISVGHERDEFKASFANHEVVMYHGHSRYGRGPAFGDPSNYFRMGDAFKTIEVDVRNRYFRSEPLQLTDQYPPKDIILENETYRYQYRGPKDETSELFSDSYTKNIRGFDTDLRATVFHPGRQIIYLYSCRNYYYFKNPLRALFPEPAEKMIIGTSKNGGWGTKPDAVMIISIVRQVATSSQIVSELNATNDCAGCFTSY